MVNNPANMLGEAFVACFFGAWIVMGLVGFALFYLGRDVAFKRKWFPRYAMLGGALFLAFASVFLVLQSRSYSSLGILVFAVPMVSLIVYLNIKFTRFCDGCGATSIDQNWFSPMRFCPKCGAKLTTAKPDPVDEL